MVHLCDFCGEQRSMIYCRSDAACLCLSCDRNIHSANALSRRHSRNLLCERCNSQPALVRCIEEKISLCQNCDWIGHGSSIRASAHRRKTINCYSGCPSAAELSGIWSFALDFPSVDDSNCEKGLSLMSINENSVSDYWGPPETKSIEDLAVTAGMDDVDKSSIRMGSSSMPAVNPMPCSADQPVGSVNWKSPKLCSPETKGFGPYEDDDLYLDFTLADIDLSVENYEELFGVSQNISEQFFENGEIDSLFGLKDMSVADTNRQSEYVAEGSSAGQVKEMQPTCSNAVSADSMMSSKTEPNLCFTARQAHSRFSHSLSGLSGESSAGDYQDCGASSMFLMGEPPWYPPCPENSIPSASRDSAVMRYKEKKKIRKFDKKIRYASRKARADIRKRVKGRFVKAGESYDYDPLCQTRSC